MYHNIVFKSSATRNGASVFAFTSSIVTPSATSISVNPSVKSTSNTASSVIILETHRWPVSGKVHSRRFVKNQFVVLVRNLRLRILGFPFLSTWSIVTTTFVFVGLATKSIAPPIPFTFPGSMKLARSIRLDVSVVVVLLGTLTHLHTSPLARHPA